jgi:hypothetical protein
VGCGADARTAFNSGLDAYFLANVATSGCFAAQTVGSGASAVNQCSNSNCEGNPGCAASFAWHDAVYNSANGQLTVQVDVSSSIAASGNVSCTLLDQSANSPVSISISAIDHDTSLSAQVNSLNASGGDVSDSGCDGLTDEAGTASDDLQILLAEAEQLAIDTIESYEVDCTP